MLHNIVNNYKRNRDDFGLGGLTDRGFVNRFKPKISTKIIISLIVTAAMFSIMYCPDNKPYEQPSLYEQLNNDYNKDK